MKFIFTLILIIGSIFLFYTTPIFPKNPLFLEIWEWGHFALFFLISFCWLYPLIVKSDKKLNIYLFVFTCFVLALITEIIQLTIPGRSFSVGDILKDMMGCMYAVILYLFLKHRISIYQFSISVSLLILLLLYQLLPLAIEEWKIHSNFPQLANFEESYELSRWSQSNTSVSDKIVQKGNFSLKVQINNFDKYSGASFKYFPNNWSDYESLQLSIYSNRPTQLTLSIQDYLHIKNYRYEDRFNQHLNLKVGWNNITIPISEIKTAPLNRMMEMNDIFSIGIFSTTPHDVNEFYIDNVYLE